MRRDEVSWDRRSVRRVNNTGLKQGMRAATGLYDALPLAPHRLADAAIDVEIWRQRRRCSRDPIWRELYEKSRITDSAGKTVAYRYDGDEYSAMEEIRERLAPDSWWLPAARLVCRRPVRRARRQVAGVVHRGLHGWAPRDCIDLNRHLCARLAQELVWLAENGHGYPGTAEYPEPEPWEAALRQQAEALRVYGAWDDSADEAGDYADAQAALHWVANHLVQLWD